MDVVERVTSLWNNAQAASDDGRFHDALVEYDRTRQVLATELQALTLQTHHERSGRVQET